MIAARNDGDPHSAVENTGNGIVLGGVRDGTIAWSTADNNGSDSVDRGPGGIWTYDPLALSWSTIFRLKIEQITA